MTINILIYDYIYKVTLFPLRIAILRYHSHHPPESFSRNVPPEDVLIAQTQAWVLPAKQRLARLVDPASRNAGSRPKHNANIGVITPPTRSTRSTRSVGPCFKLINLRVANCFHFLPFSFHFHSFSFHFHSFSFHFQSFSFHFLSFSFHFPFTGLPCPFIYFHFPFTGISFPFIFLAFSFRFHSFSFHFRSFPFIFLSSSFHFPFTGLPCPFISFHFPFTGLSFFPSFPFIFLPFPFISFHFPFIGFSFPIKNNSTFSYAKPPSPGGCLLIWGYLYHWEGNFGPNGKQYWQILGLGGRSLIWWYILILTWHYL